MTSLINLLLSSFLALSAPAAHAAAGNQDAVPPARHAAAAGQSVDQALLEEVQKINAFCLRSHFDKACARMQEDFQRRFVARLAAAQANNPTFLPAHTARQGK